MWPFRRKKKGSPANTADTFVEATSAGWYDSPDQVAADGGSQRDYVTEQLEAAAEVAKQYQIDEQFEYRLTDIPAGIQSPHEIAFGIMMRAPDYGLMVDTMVDETLYVVRLS